MELAFRPGGIDEPRRRVSWPPPAREPGSPGARAKDNPDPHNHVGALPYYRAVSGSNRLQQLPGLARVSLIAGIVLLLVALVAGSWWLGLVGVFALGVFGWAVYSVRQPQDLEPWVWPSDFRAAAEEMARRIDPTPKRVLPPDPKGPELAEVASTAEGLEHLLAEKPPLWRWAVFTSVLLQRRNAVQPRLRNCASGYQPGPGLPLDGQRYSGLAYQAMNDIADQVKQMEQFMLSPAFTGAFGTSGDEHDADADSIVHNANRLMDYHEDFLRKAERCLQTPVETVAIVFAQDTGAFAMCPLIGYDQFIITMCNRVAEGQELLPYARGTVELDPASLTIDLPDGLMEQILEHIKRFNP